MMRALEKATLGNWKMVLAAIKPGPAKPHVSHTIRIKTSA